MKLCPSCYKRNDNYADFCTRCDASLAGVPITEDFLEKAGNFLDRINGTANLGTKGGQQVSSSGTEEAQQTAEDSAVNASQAVESSAENAAEHHQEVAAKKAEAAAEKTTWEFIDPSETAQATIGTGYLQNILGGENIKRGVAILTEKRLYYIGRSFSNIGTNATASTEESIIPVSEITLTRFVHQDSIGRLVAAILCFVVAFFSFTGIIGSTSNSAPIISMMCIVLVFVGVVFLCAYSASRSTVLEIAFPGGRFCLDVKWHSITDMRNFQKQIHLVRDRLKNGGDDETSEKAVERQ